MAPATYLTWKDAATGLAGGSIIATLVEHITSILEMAALAVTAILMVWWIMADAKWNHEDPEVEPAKPILATRLKDSERAVNTIQNPKIPWRTRPRIRVGLMST
ncbi:MAG: hypothetical protein L6R37_004632 [Teloschistes peruensis]|nr:MAG: hypothetical protein L6R37_004632 [Teloschistes peruensis]